MENFSFVLWMVLYPLVSSITHYLGYKRLKIFNEDKPSDGAVVFASIIAIFIWAFIGIKLYN